MQILEGEFHFFIYLFIYLFFLSNATKTNGFCQAVGLQALLCPTKACLTQATRIKADPFYMQTKRQNQNMFVPVNNYSKCRFECLLSDFSVHPVILNAKNIRFETFLSSFVHLYDFLLCNLFQ